jgi:TM2 domain-containing membrane protein YozV
MFCRECATEMSREALACPQCGCPTSTRAELTVSPKNRVVAAVLALLLGGLGAHKFYLGKVGLGILYLVFVWTFIPAIVALIEGIVYLTKSDEEFSVKYA